MAAGIKPGSFAASPTRRLMLLPRTDQGTCRLNSTPGPWRSDQLVPGALEPALAGIAGNGQAQGRHPQTQTAGVESPAVQQHQHPAERDIVERQADLDTAPGPHAVNVPPAGSPREP